MFGRMAFERNDFVEQAIQLRELRLPEFAFHPRVMRFDGARESFDELQPLGRRFDHRAALVPGIALAPD